jgi:hypothetical protein
VIEKIYKKICNSWIEGENKDYGKWWANRDGKPQEKAHLFQNSSSFPFIFLFLLFSFSFYYLFLLFLSLINLKKQFI